MRLSIRIVLPFLFVSAILSESLVDGRIVSAAEEMPPGPDRYVVVSEEYTLYTWWLVRWLDNEIACLIEIDHDGLPTNGDIYLACGENIHESWTSTPQCDVSTTDPELCSGYYLHFIQEESAYHSISTTLPPPVVWVTLDGCVPYASTYRCGDYPTLLLMGEEPQSGYSILRLEGTVDGTPFICAPICQLDLGPTEEDGLFIRFWAYSSYGDSSEAFVARVRVRNKDDQQDPYLYVDVLTAQWRGAQLAPCALNWDTFPPVGGLDGWLASPDTPGELASDIPYEYLAGNLIIHGVVDASNCADNGLLENGYANACGGEAARTAVIDWQNRFDANILVSAQEIGVPAQLLKNLFSRESQFWPGITRQLPEAGLGQLTENGADTVLLWNLPFYEQFCPSTLGDEVCKKRYPHLTDDQRSILRHALVQSVDAFCSDCPLGIDLNRAQESISIFAETLLANCDQTGMVLDLNYSRQEFSPSYGDLWRFTLVNYNVGPGCLGLAVSKTNSNGEPLDWEHVSKNLTPVCQGAIDYVMDISQASP
jgi:hypothetical protein